MVHTDRHPDHQHVAPTAWLVGQLAHEIKTPLTSILGYADLLAADLTGLPGSLAKLELIRRNGQALLRLTRDVTALCQLESGQVHPRHETFSPRDLFAEVLSLHALSASVKGLKLEASIDQRCPLPQAVESEPGWLRQVLTNLLDNAIKYTPRGQVTVQFAFEGGGTECDKQPPGSLRLVVTDTGPGIPDEQSERIFLPFCVINAQQRERAEQTGLGLAIVKRIVTQAGGRIELSSRVGHGSSFSVSFPATPRSSARVADLPADLMAHPLPKPSTAQPQPLRGMRVLLVDDEPDSQLLLSVVLKSAGANLQLANDGATALALALGALRQQEAFDAVLMDMHMPLMDGFEAVGKLRTQGYDRRIIALTAASMSDDRDLCLAAGCDEFIAKPIEPARLVNLLATRPTSPAV